MYTHTYIGVARRVRCCDRGHVVRLVARVLQARKVMPSSFYLTTAAAKQTSACACSHKKNGAIGFHRIYGNYYNQAQCNWVNNTHTHTSFAHCTVCSHMITRTPSMLLPAAKCIVIRVRARTDDARSSDQFACIPVSHTRALSVIWHPPAPHKNHDAFQFICTKKTKQITHNSWCV